MAAGGVEAVDAGVCAKAEEPTAIGLTGETVVLEVATVDEAG